MKSAARYAEEMGLRGALTVLFAGAALAIASFALYVVLDRPLGTPPLTETTNEIPATGPQGFRATEFCEDDLTTVAAWLIPPIDTPYVAAYSMERRKDGVLETVDVFVYGDGRDPKGTHYKADGKSEDAFITKDTMKCVEAKAK